jgi:hypothetical protein
MKALLAAVLLCMSFLVHAQPVESVRVVTSSEGDKYCSAVVIAPNFALTARHCTAIGMAIDGIVVAYISVAGSQAVDIALVNVPGLKCPCAALGGRPVYGTRVVAIGFPGRLEGERRMTEAATVNYIGSAITIAPWMAHPLSINGVFIFTDKAIIDSGDSGGGLFAFQGGQWVLVGINAIGVPQASGSKAEQSSGFTPVDAAAAFLPKG